MSENTQLLLVVLAGVATVIGGILLFRLHAFLALLLGALVAGLFTSQHHLQNYFVESASIKTASAHPTHLLVKLDTQLAPTGTPLLVLRRDAETRLYEPIATLHTEHEGDDAKQVALKFDQEFTRDDWRETDAVISPNLWKQASEKATANLGTRLAAAFGSTAGQIGILIALASIIGKCMLDSGAAERIVRTLLDWFGEKGAPLAFILGGFLLAIPVFFDTVFYLMIPLGKAMGLRTGKNYLLFVLTIVAGGTMAHSLVPPTPGPLLVANELNVDLGTMILAGCGVGLASSLTGLCFAKWINARCELPLRDTPDLSLDTLRQISARDTAQLPPFWLSLMPILLPVFLIAGVTILNQENSAGVKLISLCPEWFGATLTLLGNSNMALVVGAVVSIYLLVRQSHPTRDQFAASVQSALGGAGTIILITSAGGAFGQMLKETGVASLIRELPLHSPLLILFLAFLVTAAIRTAQGSSTVAMITTVGLLGPIALEGQLGLHPVYLALAIGCGSKPIAWMNDSGFWVITRMSGMTEREGLKYITPLSILMGTSGIIVTLIAAAIYPGV